MLYVIGSFPYCRKSASCTHVSVLLHSLVALTPSHFTPSTIPSAEVEELPCTSYLCQWKVPRKRKESTMKMLDATFQKHVFGKERKRTYVQMEEFDPCPEAYCGTANANLHTLLDKVPGRDSAYLSCLIQALATGIPLAFQVHPVQSFPLSMNYSRQ